jgi:hypothetical protein
VETARKHSVRKAARTSRAVVCPVNTRQRSTAGRRAIATTAFLIIITPFALIPLSNVENSENNNPDNSKYDQNVQGPPSAYIRPPWWRVRVALFQSYYIGGCESQPHYQR